MKELIIKSFDNTKLNCILWDDIALPPKGIIQILHGMTSYAKRYDLLAKALNKEGYIVFGNDHRGHGKLYADRLGQVDINNFMQSVNDQIHITNILKEKYNLPIQIFAHSYGSFLAQRYIQLNGQSISGIILSGSAYMGGFKLAFGKIVTAIQNAFCKSTNPNMLLYNLTYKANNKHFTADKIDNAWLNRDLDAITQHSKDPLSGYIVSIGFYYSLLRGLSSSYKKKNLNQIPKELPIKLMSGERDPLGGMGKKVIKLYNLYKSNSLKKVSIKLYPEVRHELISDPDSKRIIADMVAFFNKNL